MTSRSPLTQKKQQPGEIGVWKIESHCEESEILGTSEPKSFLSCFYQQDFVSFVNDDRIWP